MTIDHPIRRVLARLCSDATMARVVDPTLADVRAEGRSAVSACVVLARALVVHSVLAIPSVLTRSWSDDDRAIPKAAAFAIAATLLASLPLIAFPLLSTLSASRPTPVIPLAVVLVPQAIPLTLPVALLVAIPLALRRHPPSARLARRIVALSIGFVAVALVDLGWAMPEANQAFRVMVVRVMTSGQQQTIPRGNSEIGFAALRDRIQRLKSTPDGDVAARAVEFHYQVRLVLAGAPLPFGVLALAIARSQRGRRRPWVWGLAALGGYLFVYFPLLMGAATLTRSSSLPPALFAWTPLVLMAIVAWRAYSSTPAVADSSAVS